MKLRAGLKRGFGDNDIDSAGERAVQITNALVPESLLYGLAKRFLDRPLGNIGQLGAAKERTGEWRGDTNRKSRQVTGNVNSKMRTHALELPAR